ncbi:hypothetical protein EDM57_14155 [Brevibacillus gelatini]|uniref:Sporulation membrane protein YtrI C-terminal domain-containing protein n=2 Tax=Brevibacillus gelatini TaxID=1655277 RepID=A0A3M8AXZ6_9BACL|nr:hypothetical protein EDM57_14155 [Brevibacillus gelatini]
MMVVQWKRYLALLLIGCLLGGTAVLFVYGREMEQMMLVRKSLELQNKKLYEENQELKQNQRVYRKKQDQVIEEVRAFVMPVEQKQPLHGTIIVQVVDLIEKDFASLKGKKAEQVAEVHQMLHEMLRRREYVLSDRTMVEVRIKTVVIARTLKVFVTAEVISDDVWQKVARNFLFLPPYIST